jgi:hypothetical protein
VGGVRQPISKGWAEETDNDLGAAETVAGIAIEGSTIHETGSL